MNQSLVAKAVRRLRRLVRSGGAGLATLSGLSSLWLALLGLAAPSAQAADGIQTITRQAFLDSIGVNIHVEYTDGQYADIDGVMRALRYLGVDQVRDQAPNRLNQGQNSYGFLAREGIRFAMTAPGSEDAERTVRGIADLERQRPGSISAIEGPNEVNNFPVSFAGMVGDKGATAFQAALFRAVRASPLAGRDVYNLTSWPHLAGAATTGNFHSYPWHGDQPLKRLADELAEQRRVMPGRPVVLTETGYYTAPRASGWGGVDEATQAKLTLNLLFDAAKLGIARTYLYQLLDAYPDPQGHDMERHFGLFDLGFRPKPVAAAIHNLTRIVAGRSAAGSGEAGEDAEVSAEGLPKGAQMLRLNGAGGTMIAVWAEPDIWDQQARRPLLAPRNLVTLRFGRVLERVSVFDPLLGASPLAVARNTSRVQIEVTDHPVIVALGSAVADRTARADR